MSLATLKTRIDYAGGDNLGRIKKQKLNSFLAALKNDYNSREIELENGTHCQCLINTNNLKSDYDKKYVSVEFKYNLQSGDTFRCVDDNTTWMVYLPILTEIAYLRAEIIRCRYQLTINDNTYWVYFQGPIETAIRWNLKQNVNWNDLNCSGTVYIKRTQETLDYFNRFTIIKLNGHNWQIKVVDSITVPGIIELEVNEYFDSITEDIPEIIEVAPPTYEIKGETNVYPYDIQAYSVDIAGGVYSVSDPSCAKILKQENGTCRLEIITGRTGSFNLVYSIGEEKFTLPIKILSL